MTFDDVWTTASLGDYLAISDGTAQPTKVGGMPWRMWRSHNFIGRLDEKIQGENDRCLHLMLAQAGGAQVAYTLHELHPHTFVSSTSEAWEEDVIVL